MDEYSPKHHDILQLKFLCESLHRDCLLNLEGSHHGWVNDPTSVIHLQLNELIEHIAAYALNYKIKYVQDSKLIECVDEYLDDSFMLFSNYSINESDLNKWRQSSERVFQALNSKGQANPVSISF